MNLLSDDKSAKIDCWLTGCRRHYFTPPFRYAEMMIDDRGDSRVIEQGQC